MLGLNWAPTITRPSQLFSPRSWPPHQGLLRRAAMPCARRCDAHAFVGRRNRPAHHPARPGLPSRGANTGCCRTCCAARAASTRATPWLAAAWGDDSESTDRTVDTHIKPCAPKRARVDAGRRVHQHHRGMGYCLDVLKADQPPALIQQAPAAIILIEWLYTHAPGHPPAVRFLINGIAAFFVLRVFMAEIKAQRARGDGRHDGGHGQPAGRGGQRRSQPAGWRAIPIKTMLSPGAALRHAAD